MCYISAIHSLVSCLKCVRQRSQPKAITSATASDRFSPGRTTVNTEASTPRHETWNARSCADPITVSLPHRKAFAGSGKPGMSLAQISNVESKKKQQVDGPYSTTSLMCECGTTTDSHGLGMPISDKQRSWLRRLDALPDKAPFMHLEAANDPFGDT